jgi:hypothetical protein
VGLPYRLDPYTLETLGLETLGGRLQPGLPFKVDSAALVEAIGALQRTLGANHLLPPGEDFQPFAGSLPA